MDDTEVKYFIEAALLAAGRPMSIEQLHSLFDGRMAPEKSEIRKAITTLNEEYELRGITISEVASGFRIQVKAAMADRLQKLWEERPPRYSRALFETLALIAYRQPITRGEIEEVRGVSVSSNIVRSLVEREWIRVVGHRDVPGRPAMFATTRLFLDYFGLKKLDDLPPLADLSDWESLRVQLNLPAVEEDEGTEMPAVPELPVLYPEVDEDDIGDESDDIESAFESDEPDVEIPELVPIADELPNVSDFVEPAPAKEELLVSEWPDPADDTAVATLDSETDEESDKDASASGG
jgi:segregation and condensation protein B